MNRRDGGQNMGGPDPLVELELTNDALRRIRESCFEKCVNQTNETELSKKEETCNDNCVMKYFDTMKMIAEHFQKQDKIEQEKAKVKK